MTTDEFDLTNVSSTMTADIIGLTRQRVSQLRSEGVLQNKGKRGRYDLTKIIPVYIAYLKRHDGASAQTRLVIERTRKLERENDRAEGEIISRDDAERVLCAFVKGINDLTRDLPKALAPRLAKVRQPFEARRLVEKAFDDLRMKLVRELKAVCGIDPDAGEKEVLARLRQVGL
jgi:hypothetical protein